MKTSIMPTLLLALVLSQVATASQVSESAAFCHLDLLAAKQATEVTKEEKIEGKEDKDEEPDCE